MATEFEVVGQRDLPGIDAENPRAVYRCVFYRKVGDASYSDFVAVPVAKATDDAIQRAIAEKEKGKAKQPARRFTVS